MSVEATSSFFRRVERGGNCDAKETPNIYSSAGIEFDGKFGEVGVFSEVLMEFGVIEAVYNVDNGHASNPGVHRHTVKRSGR